jgi:tRNA A-37 threonylcarbamoyl transferase component Bud32
MVGQVVSVHGKAYEITALLARGKGGYNYLAESGDQKVVVKQMHYEPCDYFQFEEDKLASELRDYKILFDIGIPMPKLLYHNQETQILVKEYIAGDTLAKIVADGRLRDAHISQIFAMCGKLYPQKLNIDYFPTNFVERGETLYYVDYECSQYSDEWNFENWGIHFLTDPKGARKIQKEL